VKARQGRNGVAMIPTKDIALALAKNTYFMQRDAKKTHLVIDRYHRETCRVHLDEDLNHLWDELDLDHHPELQARIWDYGDPIPKQGVMTMRHTGQVLHPLESLHAEVILGEHFIGEESLEITRRRLVEENERVIRHFYPT
jgi:hypothetical protein